MQGDDETLREALFELKVLREREAEALRESNALLKGLSSITDAARPAEALTRLLRSIEGSLGCDLVALIAGAHGAAEIREATDSTLAGLSFPAAPLRLRRPIRAADAATLTWWPAMPAPLQRFSALLIVPISLPDGEAGAILCLTGEHAGFSPDDQNLLSRLAILAAQALATLSLSERNALLAGVIAGSSASVVVADARSPETPLVYVNDAFVALSGYARAEVLGRNCRFLSAEEADSPERLRLRHCVATRSNGTFELRNRKRDGSFFWNRLTLFAVGEPGEPPRYLVATQVDITAERAAADERDLAQRRLTAALSATSEGFLLLDPHGTIVLANARYRTFFEADAAPFLPGVRFAEAWRARLLAIGYPEADAAEGARHRQDRLFGGEQNREETLPDGRVLQVSDRATSDGGAVSIATDITARVATERILAQRAAAMDATEDGIAVTDEAGRFTYMNPSHLAMFGYEREGEVLGRHWTTLYDAEKAEYLTRVGMPEIRRSGAWRTEISGRSRSGAEVEQEVSLSYLPGIGLVCVSRDISERRQNERERARLRDQLQSAQRQEAIGQLAAGVAHDFNNLLSVITTSTSLAEGDLEEGREVQSHLQRVQAAARNASRLVRRLLHLGGRPSEIRAVDLGAAMGEAADLLRAGALASVSVSLSLPDETPSVDADATDLLQVVLNLGINARDAIGDQAGEIALSLTVETLAKPLTDMAVGSVEAGRRYAVIGVRDTGPGIDAEGLARIFRPYFTTKGDGGTGLGLAVVAGIATKIGGAIRVQSTPGEGSTFTLYWPLEPAPEATPAHPTGAAEGRLDLTGAPVIVCDDVEDVAQSIAALLERRGAEVTICEDARDALAAIEEDPEVWALLVTDFDMPEMDGEALARAGRAAAPALPIVLCTALAERRKAGTLFDAVLAKPVCPEGLDAAIARAVAARRRCDTHAKPALAAPAEAMPAGTPGEETP